MSEDLREGLDQIQADMAAHQRRFSGEATASKNQALAADAFQRLENEKADARPVPAAPSVLDAPPVVEKVERKDVDGRAYLLSTSASDDIATRPGTPAETWFVEHAMQRLGLLMTKHDTGPGGSASWYQRTLAVMELQSRVPGLRQAGLAGLAEQMERRYFGELMQLLEDSNRLFGDWKAEAPKKIQVGARGR